MITVFKCIFLSVFLFIVQSVGKSSFQLEQPRPRPQSQEAGPVGGARVAVVRRGARQLGRRPIRRGENQQDGQPGWSFATGVIRHARTATGPAHVPPLLRVQRQSGWILSFFSIHDSATAFTLKYWWRWGLWRGFSPSFPLSDHNCLSFRMSLTRLGDELPLFSFTVLFRQFVCYIKNRVVGIWRFPSTLTCLVVAGATINHFYVKIAILISYIST